MSLTAVVSVTSNASRPGPIPLSRIRSSIDEEVPLLAEARAREVHEDLHVLPHLQEPEHLVDDPGVELREEPELLGRGKERARADERSGVVAEPEERLVVRGPARREAEDRLVGEDETPVAEGVLDPRGPDARLREGRGRDRGVDEDDPVPAPLLGRVEGRVGEGEERGGVEPAVDRDDADADPEVEAAAADLEAVLVDGPPEPLGHHAARLGRDPLEDEDELVAAEAGDLVARPAERPEEARELDEDGVARRVPERVVDDLEVVQVEEDERPGRPAAGSRDDALEALLDRAAVPQVRERVVQGEVADPLLGLPPLGDVLLHRDEVADRAVGPGDRRDRLLLDVDGPVLAAVVELAAPDVPAQDRLPHLLVVEVALDARLQDAGASRRGRPRGGSRSGR